MNKGVRRSTFELPAHALSAELSDLNSFLNVESNLLAVLPPIPIRFLEGQNVAEVGF